MPSLASGRIGARSACLKWGIGTPGTCILKAIRIINITWNNMDIPQSSATRISAIFGRPSTGILKRSSRAINAPGQNTLPPWVTITAILTRGIPRYHHWNSVNVGPKKDIVGEWEKAARAQGLRFGVTIHSTPSRTWRQFFPVTFGSDREGPLAGVPYDGNLTKEDGKGLWWEGMDPQELYTRPHPYGADPDPEFVENVVLRVKDVIDQYHPDLLYFDDALQPVHDLGTYPRHAGYRARDRCLLLQRQP